MPKTASNRSPKRVANTAPAIYGLAFDPPLLPRMRQVPTRRLAVDDVGVFLNVSSPSLHEVRQWKCTLKCAGVDDCGHGSAHYGARYSQPLWHVTASECSYRTLSQRLVLYTVSSTTNLFSNPPLEIVNAAAFRVNSHGDYATWQATSEPEGQDSAQEQLSSPETNPWMTLDKTVRGLDIDKVHDCKDDMDTLLVFAGLYSAVLTSFLVQSYQSLQEDPQQTTNDLLRQISSQTSSYTLSNGHLNSTTSRSTSSPPFQATITDVRINALWFASLILSLGTASFGILVKQWLREYLSIGHTVPQERIRIHYFRTRGLEEWKLFEIAAALPLVLQLPLALFFIGLCLFTTELDPTVRMTSVGLVSGWATLFSFTFLAPLFSARCPYKTTFMKTAFRRLRPHVRAFVTAINQRYTIHMKPRTQPVLSCIRRLLRGESSRAVKLLYACIQFILPWIQAISCSLHKSSQHLLATGFALCATLWSSVVSAIKRQFANGGGRQSENLHCLSGTSSSSGDRVDARLSEWEDICSLRDAEQILIAIAEKYQLEEDTADLEEDDVRASSRNDALIFKSVDGILLDDSLLLTMRAALQRQPLDIRDMLGFILSTLDNRLSYYRRRNDGAYVFTESVLKSLDGLASSTSQALVDILADDPQSFNNRDLIKLIILLARRHKLSDTVIFAFRRFFSNPGGIDHRIYNHLVFARHIVNPLQTTDGWQSLVFSTMRDVFCTLDPRCLRNVVHYAYVDPEEWEATVESKTYSYFMDQVAPASDRRRTVTLRVLKAVLNVVMSILQHRIDGLTDSKKQLDESKASDIKELLLFFFDAIPAFQLADTFIDLYLHNQEQITQLMESLFSALPLFSILRECLRAHEGAFSRDAIHFILTYQIGIVSTSMSADVIAKLRSEFAAFFEQSAEFEAPLTTYKTLLFYYITLLLFKNADEDCTGQKRRLSFHAARHLRDASCPTLDEWPSVKYLASMILWMVEKHDGDGMPPNDIVESHLTNATTYRPETAKDIEKETVLYYRWRECFDVHDSAYPDELIALLRDNLADDTTDGDGRTLWRVRRLQDMEWEGSPGLRPITSKFVTPDVAPSTKQDNDNDEPRRFDAPRRDAQRAEPE
ncbi:hypothetical protein NM688_g7571 [Phlebia brevispora]|uniref:Uncharacterized protein n=1 Tax=Phlebia brevispora TaxID=194682 RepID=A0ACC1S3R4_9APHY|nr:hypothetical protein NM688_g7571 [Phlebia brevispora]